MRDWRSALAHAKRTPATLTSAESLGHCAVKVYYACGSLLSVLALRYNLGERKGLPELCAIPSCPLCSIPW